MSRRAHITLKTKLASALLALGHVPHNDAKLLTADQICSLYAWDHFPIRKADGGADEHWNLVPRLILAHRDKTAKKDAPEMTKDRTIAMAQRLHEVRLQAKLNGRPLEEQPRSPSKMQSRPWPKMRRPMGKRKAWMTPG